MRFLSPIAHGGYDDPYYLHRHRPRGERRIKALVLNLTLAVSTILPQNNFVTIPGESLRFA